MLLPVKDEVTLRNKPSPGQRKCRERTRTRV